MTKTPYIRYTTESERINNIAISFYSLFVSLFLIGTGFVGAAIVGENIWEGFLKIILSTARSQPDYFALGGLGATFLNSGLCGLGCSVMILLNRTPAKAVTLAGYFLVISHCFFGLNFLNMWPCFLGVVLYSFARKQRVGDNLPIAMFATALGPFISEFFFSFPIGERFSLLGVEFSIVGVIFGCTSSVMFGFLVPALLPGTTKMHRGFNLYKAGIAIGLFGVFVFALMFKTFGLEASEVSFIPNEAYDRLGRSHAVFVNVALGSLFLISAVVGIILSRGNFRPYLALLKKDGHQDDFCELFGMKTCLINIGIYGLFILLYFNLAILLTDGVGFTGNVTGYAIAAVTFASCGQHPRNVYPIMLGYTALSAVVHLVTIVCGFDIPWTLSTQGYLGGLAFATGLCPFSTKFGVKYGIIAGAMSAALCSSTSAMHGGLMLYNGGFTAGLTAMLLVTVLDFYKVPERVAD